MSKSLSSGPLRAAQWSDPNPTLSVPGLAALDFSTDLGAENSMVAQGATCTIAYNPTGWHDGSGCLDWTPTGSSPTIRALLTGNLPFQMDAEDFGIEFYLPPPVDPAVTTSIDVVLGSGGVYNWQVPTKRMEWRVWYAGGGSPQSFNGVVYRRFRFDIAASDLKAGPVDGNVPITSGGGLNRYSLINWWAISASNNLLGKTVKIKRITKGGWSRPELIITTDNTSRYHQQLLTPAYINNGWRAAPQFMSYAWVNNVPTSNIGDTKACLRAMFEAGSDMNANDIVDRNINGVDYATMLADARQLRSDMAAVGFGGTDRGQLMWIYNNNGYSDASVQALKDAGFIAGRGGPLDGRYTFVEGGIRNSMRLGSNSWDGITLQSMKDRIDRCIEYGCTMHAYMHLMYEKSKLAADLPAATVPGATESPIDYRTRVNGLGETATVAYLDAHGVSPYTSWWEDVKAMIDYAAAKAHAGQLDVLSPQQWMSRHRLTAPTP